MVIQRNFDMIMGRPWEPLFTIQGDNGEKFNFSNQLVDSRYEKIFDELAALYSKESGHKIPVREIKAPDLSLAEKLDRNHLFSIYIPFHRKIASDLIELFYNSKDVEELQSLALFCRDRLNPYLLNYVLTLVILHRKDTTGLKLPSYVDIFPDKFLKADVFNKARAEVAVVPEGSRTPITMPMDFTASQVNPEQRCAYFREDISLNLSYYNWHLRNPSGGKIIPIINKNRRGELFYYFHQQIIARYNCDRLSNRLLQVKELNNLRDPIPEGYFPKLDTQHGSRSYPPRFRNTCLKDLARGGTVNCKLSTLEKWIGRIMNGIELGYVISAKGEKINLNNDQGIDCLGNIIQSSALSPNRNYYGDLCNMGHLVASFCHDSDKKYEETHSVMADNATALRDPLFYRWHAFLGTLFDLHKHQLKQYSPSDLECPGLAVSDLELKYVNDTDGTTANEIKTYWLQEDLDLVRGLNFTTPDNVFVRVTHLQHSPFYIKFKVRNTLKSEIFATVRIFIAPANDEFERPIEFEDQRKLMIELDRYVVQIRLGTNFFIRRSGESSLTNIQRDILQSILNDNNKKTSTSQPKKHSLNGWPAHLLIPKGREGGMDYHLFIMLTNYQKDLVTQSKQTNQSKDGWLYFGIQDQKYPDCRPMGFPFDRPASDKISTLEDFLLPNMQAAQISVRHENKVVPTVKPKENKAN